MPLPVLPYADLPARHGVSLIREGEKLRIIVLPVARLRDLGKGYFIGGSILGFLFVLYIYAAWRMRDRVGLLASAVWGFPLMVVASMAGQQMHRRLIFDIDSDRVSVRTIMPIFSGAHRYRPRREIGDISFNRSDAKLMIRVTGKDLVEFYVGANSDVTRWVVEILNQHLQLPVEAHATAQRVQMLPGVSSGRKKSMLVATACAMWLIGLPTFCLGFPWAALGMYLIIFSAAPLGIAFGTQDKDYYFL